MMTLNKKPKATKCSNHKTISLMVYTAKIVERILEEGKLRMELGC